MFASYNNLLLCTIHSVTPLSHKTFVLERKGKSPFQVSAGSSDALVNAPTNADLKNNFTVIIYMQLVKLLYRTLVLFASVLGTKLQFFPHFLIVFL